MKLWKSIKRNPVVNVVVLGILAQAIQKAIDDGKFDTQTVATYFLQFALAFVAREFTVPFGEHKKELRDMFMKGVAVSHATPGEEFPGDEK